MNAPETVIPDGLEPYPPQQSQHTSIFIQPDSSTYQPVSSTRGEKYSKSQFDIGTEGAKHDPHRIGGLRRRWFWLLIALISVVVIGASVGGAVGGTQANKSSASGSGSASTTTSGSSQPSSSTSSSTGTSTGSQTSSSSSTSTSTSSSASSSPTSITDCPSVNGQTYTPGNPSGGSGAYSFTKTCGGYDTDGTNLESASVATFDDCIALCSNWNYWAQSLVGIQCTSVVYLGDTSCYAKNGTQTVKSSYTDAAVALLNG